VDFDGKIVVLRMRLGNKGGGFAHSKSDLQESGCPPAKKIVEIQYTAGKWNAIFRHQGIMCATLSAGDMPLPENEAANRTMLCHYSGEVINVSGKPERLRKGRWAGRREVN
jgi:hypothetical protein